MIKDSSKFPLLSKAEKKHYFGKDKYGSRIYLTKPSWDCDWYWSFGYLGNNNSSYHLNSYQNGRNINIYDALLEDYELNPKIKKNLWLFCELVKTAYALKNTAEVLGRGGSHISINPLSELIINKDEVTRINEVVLPAIFEEIEKIFE